MILLEYKLLFNWEYSKRNGRGIAIRKKAEASYFRRYLILYSLNLTLLLLGLTALAQALDSKQARTSFGKLPLSDEKSMP